MDEFVRPPGNNAYFTRRETQERTLALWGVWMNAAMLALTALALIALIGFVGFAAIATAFSG